MNTLFSIVIPVYNRSDYLLRTYSSIKAQSYRPIELILVDNGSTDSSLAVCKSLRENNCEVDFTIKVIEESRKGASIARNTGLRNVKGLYVAFFDSDDEMSATFIADCAKTFAESNLDVVAVRTKMIFENGREKTRQSFFNSSVADHILTGMLSTVSMVLRTDFVRSIGGWNEKLTTWDDWELGIRVLLASPRIRWIKKKVYHRLYQHSESITGTKFSNALDKLTLAMEEAKEAVEKSGSSQRKSSVNALFFRLMILAGTILREDEADGATLCRRAANKYEVSRIVKCVGSILYQMARLGIRGGWFVAHIFKSL